MDPRLLKRFCEIACREAGIAIDAGKAAIVEARVRRRLTALRMHDPWQYADHLERDESGEELVQFLNVISTNVTSFLRERAHFELLSRVVAEGAARGQRRFRFWCTACSSGEEPYSAVITALEAAGSRALDLKVLATDISTTMLSRARAGIYTTAQLRELSVEQRRRFFVRQGARGEELHQVRTEVRRHVAFKRLNLAEPPFPMTGPLDMVFCRNVLIYLGRQVRQELVLEIERLLREEGYLVVGHTESLTGLRTGLHLREPSVYQRSALAAEMVAR